jgi:hypothetical protein
MNDEFKKRLSDARTRLQGAKDKANQAAAGALADADRRLTGLHSAVSLWNGVKAPLIKQVVDAANRDRPRSTGELRRRSPNRTCAFQRIRLSIQAWPMAIATS